MAEFSYQAVPGNSLFREVIPPEFWRQQSSIRDTARLEKAGKLRELLKNEEKRPSYAFELEFGVEYDMRLTLGGRLYSLIEKRLKSTEIIYIPTEKRAQITQLTQGSFQIGPQDEKWGVFYPWYGLAVVYTQDDFVHDALAMSHERTHTLGESFLVESVASDRSGSASTAKLGYSLERPNAVSRGKTMEEGVVSWSAMQTMLRQFPEAVAADQKKSGGSSAFEHLLAKHAQQYQFAIRIVDELVSRAKQSDSYLSLVFEYDLLRGRITPGRLAVSHEIDKVAFAGAARELFALPFEEQPLESFYQKLRAA